MHIVPVKWFRVGCVFTGWREHKRGYRKADLKAVGHLVWKNEKMFQEKPTVTISV